MCMYTCIYKLIYNIYIYRERERDVCVKVVQILVSSVLCDSSGNSPEGLNEQAQTIKKRCEQKLQTTVAVVLDYQSAL